MNCGRQTECAKTVAARTFEVHAIAMAARRKVRDAIRLGAVNRDKAVDGLVVAKQRLDAAQVAEAFFANITDKDDVSDRFHARRIESTDDGQQVGESARVITDSRRVKFAVLFFDRQ